MAKQASAAQSSEASKACDVSIYGGEGAAELRWFSKGDRDHPGFSFTRYWWHGDGPREGIEPWIRRKMKPGREPGFEDAAKVEVLLPQMAPSDYASVDFLMPRFDATLPPFECHAMIQTKIELDDAETWHFGYERVRAYAQAHFAVRFPTILVAHVPNTVGLEGYGSHVHCIVLSRPIGINGFGGACSNLCSDRGYAAALSAWENHLAAAEVRA